MLLEKYMLNAYLVNLFFTCNAYKVCLRLLAICPRSDATLNLVLADNSDLIS